jgi:uncharacterized SAM-binding protein YcdF (DUF218 family)
MIKYFIAFAVVLVLGITLVGVYLAPDDLSKCGDKPSNGANCQKADAIVAVSGGNTAVRTAEAIRLYENGWADMLIFSGAALDEYSPSNAEVMRTQAIKAGVPADDIIIEQDSRTTHQNANNVVRLFKEHNVNQIIVVTSPYHQRRAGLEFQHLAGGSLSVRNHPAANDPDWSAVWWLTPRGWWLAGSELVKIGAVQSGNSQ